MALGACSVLGGDSSPPATPTPLPGPQVSVVAAPNPEEAARRYLQAWQAQDYAAMYAMLSPLTRDAISEQAFTDRYEEMRQGIGLTGLDYEVVSSLILSPRLAQVRFRANLQSAAVGPIPRDYQMELSRTEGDWGVAWSDALILPELNSGQGTFLESVAPVRANVYDRNGLALAAGSEVAALWLVPNQIGDEEAEGLMLSTVRSLLDLPSDEWIQARYEAIRDTDFRINLGEAPLEEFNQVSGTLADVGGVQWRTYDGRYYFGGGLAPHAVGYVSQIQADQLADYQSQGYRGDEFVGQIGLEQAYEQQLRGVPGGTLYLTDAAGRPSQAIASRDPEPPYAVYTTLDRDLQRYAQQAIQDSDLVGAVVVLERDTGAVLAMASSPGFDPNLFDTDNPNSSSGLAELFQRTDNPFLNRATLAALPPGSVFKIVTMAAALESGFYTPDTVYNCGLDFTELPGITLYDWRYDRELPAAGEITLQQGLELSCNPYFYHIGLDLYDRGLPEAIPDMAKGFGLGQPTGIELQEAAGTVPDAASKLELFGEPWTRSDPVQMAIGQSFLQVTPLQVARLVAAVGNGGTLYRPQIVQSVQNAEGEVIQTFEPEAQGTLPVSPETLAAIQQAMVGVVRAGRVVRNLEGTAYRRFLGLAVDVAGKTGTAQSGFANPHAWFAGYTFEGRQDKPDIAVVVMLEFQGEGSEWAAPVFRRVVEAYFLGRPISPYPWEARIRVPRTETPVPEEGEATPTPEP
jgi:penicillin-binding protein 2